MLTLCCHSGLDWLLLHSLHHCVPPGGMRLLYSDHRVGPVLPCLQLQLQDCPRQYRRRHQS